jgi:tight adherence protein C
MSFALFAFTAIFILIASGGLLIFYREAMLQRLSHVISPPKERKKWTERLSREQAGASIKAAVQPFERLLPKSPTEVSVVEQRLIRAGFRDESAVRIFYGAKVITPIVLVIAMLVSGATSILSPFFAILMALGVGYLLPDFWLGRKIKNRQLNIRLGLPDFLDLMVVCIEAGLSLDYAVDRSVKEFHLSQPDICDEFGLVLLEQRAGRPRIDCWKNLADRIDIDVIRTLTSSVIQADQFGTSIAKTLRTYSETLRTQRRQRVEELAAKTAVKLVFPLVLFIFPPLFIIALGPAALSMVDTFKKYLS